MKMRKLVVLFGLIALFSCKSKETAVDNPKEQETTLKNENVLIIDNLQNLDMVVMEGADERLKNRKQFAENREKKTDSAGVAGPMSKEEVPTNGQTKGENVFFRMQRTPCYGQCPIYTVEIYNDGNALLEGRKFVDRLGKFKATFSRAEMSDILRIAEEAGYFSMKQEYNAPVTDLPSTITYLNTGSMKHGVTNRMDAPHELIEMEKEIEQIIWGKNWEYLGPVD